MDDNGMDNFKISLDEESPDKILSDDVNETKPPASNTRLFVFFVLMVILFSVGLGAVYIDIKKRLAANMNAGTTVVSNISKEVSANLSAIVARQQEYETKMDGALVDLIKSTTEMNNRLRKIESSLGSINASKSDKKELTAAITDFEKKVGPVQTALETLTSEMGELNERVKQEVASTRNGISSQGKKLEIMSKDLAILNVDKVDKKTFEKSIEKSIEKGIDRYAEKLGKLSKEIEFIRYKIKIIEERLPAPTYGEEPAAGSLSGEKKESISEQTLE